MPEETKEKEVDCNVVVVHAARIGTIGTLHNNVMSFWPLRILGYFRHPDCKVSSWHGPV